MFKILKIIAREGKYSVATISQKLGISEELVAHMVEKLIEMGYLTKVNKNNFCSSCGSCGVCNGSCGCSSNTELNILEITEKGKVVLERM